MSKRAFVTPVLEPGPYTHTSDQAVIDYPNADDARKRLQHFVSKPRAHQLLAHAGVAFLLLGQLPAQRGFGQRRDQRAQARGVLDVPLDVMRRAGMVEVAQRRP